jgi:O-antigen ligase
MPAVAAPRPRATAIRLGLLALMPVLVAATVALDVRPQSVVPALAALTIAIAAFRAIFRWRGLLALTLLVILFVPIGRYTLPGHLPVDIEPYRLVVGLLIVAWLGALLVDPRIRLRSSGFDRYIAAVFAAALVSDAVNFHRVGTVTSHVVKNISFLASFALVFAVVASLVQTQRSVERILKLLVACGAFIGASATVERRTQFNVFDHLHQVLPVLQYQGYAGLRRGGDLRAFASAEHPIALSALLVCLVPLAVYLAWKGSKAWWLAVVALALGNLATASRTGVVMLFVVVIVFLALRPAATRRLWPALVPAIVVVHVFVPGAIGFVYGSFGPGSSLVASQQGSAHIENGRLSHYYRARIVLETDPLFGNGFATRVTGANEKDVNSPVFDNQWLGTLVDTGLVGLFAWLAIFVGVVSRFAKEGKRDLSDRGWLLVSFSASLFAFGVSMFLFDAFSFTQVTFVFWILLALGAVTLRLPRRRTATAPPAAVPV